MKHLPKHLQPRWRYLAVEIEATPDISFDRGDLQRELWYAAQNLLGDPGSAEVDLRVITFSPTAAGAEAIVRVRRGTTRRARAAIACVDELDGIAVGVRVRGKSGTVRACEESYLGGAPEEASQRNVVFEDESRPAFVRREAVDVRVDDSFVGATELDFE